MADMDDNDILEVILNTYRNQIARTPLAIDERFIETLIGDVLPEFGGLIQRSKSVKIVQWAIHEFFRGTRLLEGSSINTKVPARTDDVRRAPLGAIKKRSKAIDDTISILETNSNGEEYFGQVISILDQKLLPLIEQLRVLKAGVDIYKKENYKPGAQPNINEVSGVMILNQLFIYMLKDQPERPITPRRSNLFRSGVLTTKCTPARLIANASDLLGGLITEGGVNTRLQLYRAHIAKKTILESPIQPPQP